MPPLKPLTFTSFENEVKSGNLKPVYFISVSGTHFAKKAVEMLSQKLFGSTASAENVYVKYADETKYNEIIDLCLNVTSLFSTKKLVIVKRAEKLSRTLKYFLNYASSPDPDTVLVLFFDRDYVKESKLDKEHEFYDFTDIPFAYFLNWVKDAFVQRGCRISDEELNFFASSVPFDFDAAAQEIEKVSNYLGDTGTEAIVTKVIIARSGGFEQTYTPPDLMAAIVNRDMKRCMDISHYLLNKAGVNEIYLLSILTNLYSDMLCFKSPGISGVSSNELYRKYGIWGERAEFGRMYGGSLTSVKFASAFEAILETDRKIKTSMIEPRVLMTSLIETLTNL